MSSTTEDETKLAPSRGPQSLKMQKQTYRSEKKRVAAELVTALKDPTVVVMADWLKIRGTLRKWTRMYCVLKPGILLIYKSAKTHKHGYWVGTVLLSSCELIERPSKKDGFCFKLFHPLDQSIWATRGPRGESLGAVTQPLPGSYLICRAASEEAGTCWMDALELALRCSSLLMRTMNKLSNGSNPNLDTSVRSGGGIREGISRSGSIGETGSPTTKTSSSQEDLAKYGSSETGPVSPRDISIPESSLVNLDPKEAEKHFEDVREEEGSEGESEEEDTLGDPQHLHRPETQYEQSAPEVFGALGDAEQTEEVAEENKSLIWTLMKQVRPGMDLSKVVLPTFILEPRSFLEKLADFYYHSDLLMSAIKEDDPFQRMKGVLKYYLSGFYKKPKGLKKPYNPILGEVFRCYWQDKDPSHGKTFYISEQVSHHPPVSAFHVTNRQAGFNICGTVLAKSKFYGNSLSAIMVGSARLTLLGRGENYTISLPYAHCKGLIMGTLTVEMGGQVTISCDRTSYVTELEFKLKPFLGGADVMNSVVGKIKLGREVLADIDGHWDGIVNITERQSGKKEILWQPTSEVIKSRLQRYEVPVDMQKDNESVRMWRKVSEAIKNEDQIAATDEKTVLEEKQRNRAKALRETNEIHEPTLFEYEPASGLWLYKHADYRPWDPVTDMTQTEGDFLIFTRSKLKTPILRSGSLSSGLTGGGPELEGETGPHLISSDEDNETEKWIGAQKARRKKSMGQISAEGLIRREDLEKSLAPIQQSLQDLNQRLTVISNRSVKGSHSDGEGFLNIRSTSKAFLFLAILLGAQAVLLSVLLRRFANSINQNSP